MPGESIDGRACIVCGAHIAREHVHRHELPGWKMRYADLEGALEGYETVALDCPADTPMGSCVPRCGAQMCDEARAEVGRLREVQARIDRLDSLCGEWGSLGRLLESVSNGLAMTADWNNSNTDKRACEALRRVAHELDLLERDS